MPIPIQSIEPVTTQPTKSSPKMKAYPDRHRIEESGFTLAKAPLCLRLIPLFGQKWTRHLNIWPDDTSPIGINSVFGINVNLGIGRWFSFGFDYSYDEYYGNGRPSNTSPMPTLGAWYEVEQERSHKFSIMPGIKIFEFKGKGRTASVETLTDQYGRKSSILIEHGPVITGAVRIAGQFGKDYVDFNSNVPHGYMSSEGELLLVGVSLGLVVDIWTTKHIGLNIAANSRYTYSFNKDKDFSKPSVTFLELGIGLSIR